MKMKYISRIRSGLRGYNRIDSKKATARIIDGSYNSVYKGRSMNFDELREYVPGANIKDMDWKASARSGRLLVKQYIAEKKHNIMFVMDTTKRMLADTMAGQEKRDVAIMSAGTLAYMVNRQRDYIGAVFSEGKGICSIPFSSELLSVEIMLQKYHDYVTMDNNSDINDSLEYIVCNFKQRMIVVIVTDIDGVSRIQENVLRRLLVKHDVILINIGDVDIAGSNVYDVETGSYLPEFFTGNKKLICRIEEQRRRKLAECETKLKRYGVAHSTIQDINCLDKQLGELLDKHRSEKR